MTDSTPATAATENASVVRVLEELRRSIDSIPGTPIKTPWGDVWVHTRAQVDAWLSGLTTDALNDHWEWSDAT